MKHRIIPYNPKLRAHGRDLRKRMTLAEVLLWKRLKGRQVLGVDFDRQRPIGEFIVDFYAKELLLAVEVDGRSHDFKLTADLRWQNRLESLGIRFLRFWDSEVKNDMGTVVQRIKAWIRSERNRTEEPTPVVPSEEGT